MFLISIIEVLKVLKARWTVIFLYSCFNDLSILRKVLFPKLSYLSRVETFMYKQRPSPNYSYFNFRSSCITFCRKSVCRRYFATKQILLFNWNFFSTNEKINSFKRARSKNFSCYVSCNKKSHSFL